MIIWRVWLVSLILICEGQVRGPRRERRRSWESDRWSKEREKEEL